MLVLVEREAEVTKPAYKVPLMSEVEILPPNGRSVVSTFSGCGGSCLGFRMAGYETLWASEFIPEAQVTYRANHPGVPLDERDIRLVKPNDILATIGLDVGELDVFEGSPPCSSFSTAGSREAGWGKVKKYSDTEQRTDDLFFEYVRLLRGIRPKVFVAENVSGLVKGTAKGYFKEILAELRSCGYKVSARVLDAQWLGVPQARERLIFVGVRDDLGVEPAHPRPLAYRYSIREALAGVVVSPAELAEVDISRFAIGEEYRRVKIGGASERYFNLVRPDLDKPCPTVTQTAGNLGAASVVHPLERRKFTVAELRRLCGFPDDFKLTGTYSQQCERLGRAVPPLMMRAVAATVHDEILSKIGGTP